MGKMLWPPVTYKRPSESPMMSSLMPFFLNNSMSIYVGLASGLLFLYIGVPVIRNQYTKKHIPYPPGPKGFPLIGNLFDMPKTHSWITFDKWLKEYGDIISFNVLGKRFVVLGSLQRTNDLFENRSLLYSSRPRMLLLEMIGWDAIMSLLPYGRRWRKERKLFRDYFHQNIVEKYIPVQTKQTHTFLLCLLESPEQFSENIYRSFATTVLEITYGIKVIPGDNIFVNNLKETIHGLDMATTAASLLLDSVPALRNIPSWFPGAGFKRETEHYRKVLKDVGDVPWERLLQSMREGTNAPCIATEHLESITRDSKPHYEEEIDAFKWTLAAACIGAFDTTSSALRIFFLAMTMYPDVQRKAQQEIDAIVGRESLPDYSYRPDLPYINAIVKETMRWKVVVPTAIAHTVTEDDIYDGYLIPKGTAVIGSAWTILHDPEVYPDPETFNPERFLKDGKMDLNARDPLDVAFGFGRRACPGRYFGDNGLYLYISSILAAFNISPPIDEKGVPIPMSEEMTVTVNPITPACLEIVALIRTPVPFKCTITPRSSAAEALIRMSQET